MKHATVASFLGAFALPGVLLAGASPGIAPSGFSVSGTDPSTPAFSWAAPVPGAEIYNLKVERFSEGTWSAAGAANVPGDQTTCTFKDAGKGFPPGIYRAAVRARSTFWTGPWTPWREFTVAAAASAPVPTAASTEDLFPRLPVVDTNAPAITATRSPARTYDPARNPWTASLKKVMGVAASAPPSRTVQVQPGAYRWDRSERKAGDGGAAQP